jgi:hypothetical protein
MHSLGDPVESFKDIRIVGPDKSRTHNPDKSKSMYDIYLTLSENPPAEWCEAFQKAHDSYVISQQKRKVRVDGNCIVIHCPLDEVHKHVEALKEDVASANKEYRKRCLACHSSKKEDEQRRSAEERAKSDALDKLKFD